MWSFGTHVVFLEKSVCRKVGVESHHGSEIACRHGVHVGQDQGLGEIVQYLIGWRAVVEPVGGISPVQRAHPALGCQNDNAVAITLVIALFGTRGMLGPGIGK